ncbi:MAG: PAS domain-containing protein [Planctomycetes bacterium]|nr:PAS domain-containing protein [Planctomycetota bacterium]
MSEHDLFDSVEQARERLTALRARLEDRAGPTGSREVVSVLRELQDALDKLRARYGLLLEVLDQSNDMLFAKNLDGRYAMINPRGAELLGKPVSEILGAEDSSLFATAVATRIRAIDLAVMDSGVPQTRDEVCDVRGVSITLATTTAPWYDAQHVVRGVIGVARDVTTAKRSEREALSYQDRLRTMAVESAFDEERLRQTLAAELQNGLGQDIALAKLMLATLRGSAGVELHDPLTGIEQLVERADRSLRVITFRISPPSLHDLGLVAALQWLAEDIESKHGVVVHVEDDSSPAIENEHVRGLLFRAVRELLTNVATHSHAREATVLVQAGDEGVRITVSDSGAGFDVDDIDRHGYGLFGIREQLRHVGGRLQVASDLGRGTTVIVTAPCAELETEPIA